jgi:1-acyl-sn-glycerol-3-phosphate acyltransferase
MAAPSDAPPAGPPLRGSAPLRAVGRLGLRLTRFRIVGALPATRKMVVIVAPHTSNWDFFIGVFAMFTLDLRVYWLGKDSLFHGLHGRILRSLGGRPVRRDASEGVVADVLAVLESEPAFLLALAPEGTRKPVDRWRTGFYRIAEAARVPIVPVWLDWSRREVGIAAPFHTSGDIRADFAALQANYRAEMGRHPAGYVVAPQ